MKKMTAAQIKEKAEHQAKVQAAWAALDTAVADFNAAKSDAWSKVDDAKTAFAESIAAANEWRDGIHTAAVEFYDSRTDKWKEGAAGGQYSGWIDVLGTEFEDDTDNIDQPDDVDAPEDVSDAIGEMPESAEES